MMVFVPCKCNCDLFCVCVWAQWPAHWRKCHGHNCDLRGNNFLERRRVKSARYGTESISSLAPKMWEILPNEVKDLKFLK